MDSIEIEDLVKLREIVMKLMFVIIDSSLLEDQHWILLKKDKIQRENVQINDFTLLMVR